MLYTPHNLINMNHGLINMLHKGFDKTDNPRIIELYNNVQEMREYFSRYKGRDRYYVAMKAHAAELLYKMGLTQQTIMEILNMTNHSSVSYLLNRYVKQDDHKEFINGHFITFVKTFLYPLSEKRTGQYERNYFIATKLEKPELKVTPTVTRVIKYPPL